MVEPLTMEDVAMNLDSSTSTSFTSSLRPLAPILDVDTICCIHITQFQGRIQPQDAIIVDLQSSQKTNPEQAGGINSHNPCLWWRKHLEGICYDGK